MQYRRWVFAGLSRLLCSDDSFDDNHDDNCFLNHHPYTAEPPASCLFTVPAWSWQCGGQGFESP
jgi:hypothetical protein